MYFKKDENKNLIQKIQKNLSKKSGKVKKKFSA